VPILGPPCIFVTVSIYLQWGFLEVSRGDKKNYSHLDHATVQNGPRWTIRVHMKGWAIMPVSCQYLLQWL